MLIQLVFGADRYFSRGGQLTLRRYRLRRFDAGSQSRQFGSDHPVRRQGSIGVSGSRREALSMLSSRCDFGLFVEGERPVGIDQGLRIGGRRSVRRPDLPGIVEIAYLWTSTGVLMPQGKVARLSLVPD